MIIPIILAGGAGSRLWPISRSALPKQLLSLIDDKTLLQNTILRTQSIENTTPPTIICNQEHRFLVSEQLQNMDINDATIILEPSGRNTAPAATIAALYYEKINPILLILPADHFIKDNNHFAKIINNAVISAKKSKLVTFGVTPTQPEIGYGYIKATQQISENIYSVAQFVEKPDFEAATTYLTSGEYYWNSGIFMFTASSYLTEIELYSPTILQICRQTVAHLIQDKNFIRLNNSIFSACPSNSIDYAVMEKTKKAVLTPLNTPWSDIGSWSALCDIQQADQDGNILQGDVFTKEVSNSYLRAESRMLAVVGVNDHIIVETPDAVLVAHKNKSQEIKNIVSHLKQHQRTEIDLHRRVSRPWGYYDTLHKSECFQVKHITIKPNASLSLQMHHHRSEHWVVVNGTATVTRGEEIFALSKNESTYIPKLIKHRLQNLTDNNLEIIEVQLGDYLGEDDIVRYDDIYGRNINS